MTKEDLVKLFTKTNHLYEKYLSHKEELLEIFNQENIILPASEDDILSFNTDPELVRLSSSLDEPVMAHFLSLSVSDRKILLKKIKETNLFNKLFIPNPEAVPEFLDLLKDPETKFKINHKFSIHLSNDKYNQFDRSDNLCFINYSGCWCDSEFHQNIPDVESISVQNDVSISGIIYSYVKYIVKDYKFTKSSFSTDFLRNKNFIHYACNDKIKNQPIEVQNAAILK